MIDPSELSSISEKTAPGDILVIKSGTYNNVDIVLNANGTQSEQVYIKAENMGDVIFTGSSKLEIKGSHTTVSNLIFKNGEVNKAIRIGGISNRFTNCDISYSTDVERIAQIDGVGCRIDHCVFHDHEKGGPFLVVNRSTDKLNYALIDHNIFKNRPKVDGQNNGMEAVRIGTSETSLSPSRTILEHNYFEACDGEIEIVSVKACENILRNNEFINCNGTLTLRHGNKNIVKNNKFDGQNKSNSGGVRIIGEDHIVISNLFQNLVGNERTRAGISFNCGVKDSPLNRYFQVKRAKVLANDFLNCNTAFAIGYVKEEANLKPVESEISNNMVYSIKDSATFSEHNECIGSDDMTYTNNVLYVNKLGNAGLGGNEGIIVKPPAEFEENMVVYDKYGSDKTYGLSSKSSAETELVMTVEQYYTLLMSDSTDPVSADPVSATPVDTTNPTELNNYQDILNKLVSEVQNLKYLIEDLRDEIVDLRNTMEDGTMTIQYSLQ